MMCYFGFLLQTLKRKEREYEHTMERLAREKIASQQRLAALRKEVSSLPGYTGPTGTDGLSAEEQMELDQADQEERDDAASSAPGNVGGLTVANVAAHALRDEELYGRHGQERSREADQESNSGTSTASERGDYVSDEESATGHGPSTFPPESYSHTSRQPIHVIRPVAQLQQQPQQQQQHQNVNGRMDSPGPGGDESQSPSQQAQTSRPYNIKYVRAAPATSVSSSTITTLAAAQQPATYLTVVPASEAGTVVAGSAGQLTYQVQHHQPSTIAFATAPGGQHHHQILAAHHGVQLLATTAHPHHGTGSTTLKVLTTGPAVGGVGGTSVRLVAADGISTSLQSLVTVSGLHRVSQTYQILIKFNLNFLILYSGGKVSEESGGGAASSGFCIPAGVVIPNLVALPASTASSVSEMSSNASSSGTATGSCSAFDLARSTASPLLKSSSTSSNPTGWTPSLIESAN